MERRLKVAIAQVDIGASIEKDLDALMVAIRRCIVERRVVVVSTSTDIGLSIKQQLDALMMAT